MTNARPPARTSAPWVVALVVVVAGLGFVVALSPAGTAILLIGALLAAAATLPLWVLPAVSLWVFALVPIGYIIGVDELAARFWTPAVVVIGIWGLRLALGRSRRDFVRALRWMLPLALVLVFLGHNGVSSTRSFNWIGVLFVTVAIPVAVVARSDDRTSSTLLRSWLVLGIGLSLVAVLEALVESNPLAAYYSFDQHWAIYRVTTTLGHPLINGTFFSVTACLAAFSALRRDGYRAAGVICFALSGLAAGLTGSRSGVYALVCGLGVGLLVLLVSGRTSIANKLLGIVLGTVALVVLPALPTIADRAQSAEGIASSLYRDQVIKVAGKLFLARPTFGWGPGTSSIANARAGEVLPLENAVLGTLVSMGVVGALCLLVLVVLVLVKVGQGRRPDGFAAVGAFVVAGSAFPLWETNAATLVLVGLVVVACRRPDLPTAAVVVGPAVARRHVPAPRRTLVPAARAGL